MKRLSLNIAAVALMLLVTQNSHGQNAGLVYSVGAASVRMDDMKYLQEHILSTYPVEGKITSSFPPFTSMSIIFYKQLYEQIRIGGGYSYSATGGKSSYGDYSGTLYTEFSATSHRLGAYLAYTVMGGERLDLSLHGKVDANLSYLTIRSAYNILYFSNTILNKYRTISPAGTVGAELIFKFGGFSLGLDAGYLVDLTGELKHTKDNGYLLDPNDQDRALTTDWTGWQLHLAIHIPLNI